MNKKHFIFYVVLYVLYNLFSVKLFCESQLIVKIGTWKNFPAIFENENISSELKQSIIDDISSVFAHRKECRIYKSRNQEIKIDGKTETIDTYIDFAGKYNFRPKEFTKNNLYQLFDKGGLQYLVIPESLVNDYNVKINWMLKHKDAVTKLDEFIKVINNRKYLEQLSQNDLVELIYFPLEYRTKKFTGAISREKMINGLCMYSYNKLSCFGFKDVNYRGEPMIWYRILMTKENFKTTMKFFYLHGKWKALMFGY